MPRLTQEQLEAIRQRAENATPGPWKVYEKAYEEDAPALIERLIGTAYEHPQLKAPAPVVTKMTLHPKYHPSFRISIDKDDATFIAHARTDIPALLDHITELAAELARLKDALIEISELSDEFFNVKVIDGQPTFVLKEGLEAYSDIIHEIAIVSNEAVNGKEDDQ